jgi:hypothetical protein
MYNPRKNLFLRSLGEAFAGYAEKDPVQTAFLMNRLVFPDGNSFVEDPDEYRERVVWIVSLMHFLSESTAIAVMKEMRCFEDNEENDGFIKDFVFETARLEEIDSSVIISAFAEFAELEAEGIIDGIDRARIITESVYGSERTTRIINELTDSIEEENARPIEDAN